MPAGRPTPVMYIANSGKIGGGNRVLMQMAHGLDPSRFEPFVVIPFDGPMVAWARATGVPWAVVADGDVEGRLSLLRRAGPLTRLIIGRRIEVVHAMAPSCYRAAGLAGRLTGASTVCHFGCPPTAGEIAWNFRFGPDAAIGCHQSQACDLTPLVRMVQPRCRVVGIPNGVDTTTFTATRPGLHRWRFDARHVVLIVGNLHEVKGYPTFLKAAKQVAAVVPDCAFVSLGGDTNGTGYRTVLERQAHELGISERVHFLGWRDEVGHILSAADVVTMPSLAEGLPMAILEAMACARPVVATSVGGNPEAVLDGVTGLLVPVNDSEALAAALIRLLRDPQLARSMGAAGRRRVEAHFSVERFLRAIEALYEDLRRSGRRPNRPSTTRAWIPTPR
jgi:glycosyltransferase involved in cell wall biosynthesis